MQKYKQEVTKIASFVWQEDMFGHSVQRLMYFGKGKGYIFMGGNSVFCLPSEKGSTLKGKNLLRRGANSSLLDPFSEGSNCG